MPVEKLSSPQRMAREMVRMQFALALVLVGVAVWLVHIGETEIGSGVIAAVLTSWVNEGVHRGKTATRSINDHEPQEPTP